MPMPPVRSPSLLLAFSLHCAEVAFSSRLAAQRAAGSAFACAGGRVMSEGEGRIVMLMSRGLPRRLLARSAGCCAVLTAFSAIAGLPGLLPVWAEASGISLVCPNRTDRPRRMRSLPGHTKPDPPPMLRPHSPPPPPPVPHPLSPPRSCGPIVPKRIFQHPR